MKKLVCVVFAFLLLFVPAKLFAHPASEINAKYDSKEKKLTITVKHGTYDKTTHYINCIKIYTGETLLIEQNFFSQEEKGQTAFYYVIDLNEGAELTIDTRCSKGGDLKKKVKL